MSVKVNTSLITIDPEYPFFYFYPNSYAKLTCLVCYHEEDQWKFVRSWFYNDHSEHLRCPGCGAREETTLGIRIVNLMMHASWQT